MRKGLPHITATASVFLTLAVVVSTLLTVEVTGDRTGKARSAAIPVLLASRAGF